MPANQDRRSNLLVRTESGEVLGTTAHGVRTWRGIPFAAPPVGALRFRRPLPPEPWQGTRQADAFGPLPMQKRGFEAIGGAGARTPMSEDCLTINVSAPLADSPGLRPVIVWIYGGGFSLGGTRTPLYRGDHLVERGDAVFVSFNYRVGLFGFSDFSAWSTPEHPIDSNLGLRDQVAALDWVRRNIAKFSGDPDNVTLVGQSAGAASVVALMCVPAAAGLFHRAYAMSASAACAYTPERHAVFSADLLDRLGIDPGDRNTVARALKTVSAEKATAVASTFFYDVAPDKYPGFLPSAPVIDGDFLPRHPIDAFRSGLAQRIPLVIGTMAREGATLDKLLPVICSRVSRLEPLFAGEDPALRQRIVAAYPGYPSKKTAIDVAGDLNFWLPTLQIAEGHSRMADCWVYRFDYATPLTRLLLSEASHGLDLPMLFGTPGEGPLGRFDLFCRRRSEAMSRRFQDVFLDFTRGLAPGWSRYDADRRPTRIFDRTDREDLDPCRERRLAWGTYRGPT
ncbi:carboxylesterase/lipase family protein [Methylobacterium sp. E-066]|uniref:carboxylesterase/lipase family protein n=1 Tax=Methylobacterium sp. E-066 TaxID=2836584 RepID=UPI001FB9AF12|nr:carboxylesterase/lipase family protein [Methylobacterium sp. E-066]MCJ2141593.1 carboxylesterase/lipase family protein [Methylobacterium sp. E-066]